MTAMHDALSAFAVDLATGNASAASAIYSARPSDYTPPELSMIINNA
jgi:hypothetical protein